jgi:hypothetical protein
MGTDFLFCLIHQKVTFHITVSKCCVLDGGCKIACLIESLDEVTKKELMDIDHQMI